jgi:hypothetical protein
VPVGGWSTGATVSRSTVNRGQSISITATVRAGVSTTALIDVEVYDSSGRKVYQKWWDNTSLTAGATRSFATSWTIPSGARTGTYTVKIGVFGKGWNGLFTWNNSAKTFVVQ